MLMYIRNDALVQFENYTLLGDNHYLVKDSEDKFIDVVKYTYSNGITMIRRVNERNDLIDLSYRLTGELQEYYLNKLLEAEIINYSEMYKLSKEMVEW